MTRLEYMILHSYYPRNASIVLDQASIGGIPAGSTGRVISINQELNTILVDFDCGMQSSLIYGSDIFHRDTYKLLRE